MTLKERTRPARQETTQTALGAVQWLAVAVLIAAVAVLAIRVIGLIGDEGIVPAVPATENGMDWTLEEELAAIRGQSLSGQPPAETPLSEWTLDEELAAIQGNGRVGPNEPSQSGEPVTQPSGPR